jgi:hypothetical protein
MGKSENTSWLKLNSKFTIQKYQGGPNKGKTPIPYESRNFLSVNSFSPPPFNIQDPFAPNLKQPLTISIENSDESMMP